MSFLSNLNKRIQNKKIQKLKLCSMLLKLKFFWEHMKHDNNNKAIIG